MMNRPRPVAAGSFILHYSPFVIFHTEVPLAASASPKQQPGGGGYEVTRPQGRCTVCSQEIAGDVRFMAALIETPAGFQRSDTCLRCWDKFDRVNVIAFWQTQMPRPEQKKRLFVDDTVLCELFERLAWVTEPPKLNFRFVLALVLMRKRLLIYESTRKDGEGEIWSVRLKGREDILDLLNPKLDESQMKEVGDQLSQILNEGL